MSEGQIARLLTARAGYGKAQVNHNVVGKELRVDGKDVGWGIGTHARSEIVYRLPAGTTRFRAQSLRRSLGATFAATLR